MYRSECCGMSNGLTVYCTCALFSSSVKRPAVYILDLFQRCRVNWGSLHTHPLLGRRMGVGGRAILWGDTYCLGISLCGFLQSHRLNRNTIWSCIILTFILRCDHIFIYCFRRVSNHFYNFIINNNNKQYYKR